MRGLAERRAEPRSEQGPRDLSDEQLLALRRGLRQDLVTEVRRRLRISWQQRGASPAELGWVDDVFDPDVLTIGFARRFATYKRATLWMRDLERIKRILFANKHRKVQFVIAGKAHPKDIPGKELIRDINHFIREQGWEKQVVFVPNYDIHIARLMVAGCDIWLNTPRRPREASGTSGMKAAMNGLPNLSVLDGWWDEADYVRTGWAIGHGEMYDDPNYQDQIEANALYDLLEKEVAPLFYDRDVDSLPRRWIAKMKDAIRLNCPFFNTARMVREYAQRAYFPASDRYDTLTSDDYAPAKELATWKENLTAHWYDLKIKDVDVSSGADVEVNQTITVTAKVDLATLTNNDVQVELYQGAIDDNGDIVNGVPVVMNYQGEEQGLSIYSGDILYTISGLQGLSLRVLPKQKYLSSPYEPRCIVWAQ